MNSTGFIDGMHRIFSYYPSYPNGTSEAGMDALLFEYTYWENKEAVNESIIQLDHAFADREFICDIQTAADKFAEAGLDVYFYHFSQRYKNHFVPELMGVIHTDEMHMLFGGPFFFFSVSCFDEDSFLVELLEESSRVLK